MRRMLLLLLLLWMLPLYVGAESPRSMETPDVYQSPMIRVEITRQRINNSDVYVADVQVTDVTSLRRGFARGGWGKGTQGIRDIARDNDAIVALTGDSCQYFTTGWVVGNGEIIRSTHNGKRDLCLILDNGEMVGVQSADIRQEALLAMSDRIWQSFLFGPILLDENGKALKAFPESNVPRANPRSAIGYYAPGHYCLVQVDGRRTPSALGEPWETNTGMSLVQLAELMESLGCTMAYNLDGGQSAAMWFRGEIISTPANGGRGIGDAVLVAEPEWLVED